VCIYICFNSYIFIVRDFKEVVFSPHPTLRNNMLFDCGAAQLLGITIEGPGVLSGRVNLAKSI
jgi:hypothetical protein